MLNERHTHTKPKPIAINLMNSNFERFDPIMGIVADSIAKEEYYKEYNMIIFDVVQGMEGMDYALRLFVQKWREQHEGLIITRQDKKFRVILNANNGLIFQKGNGNGEWTDETAHISSDGTAVIGGDLHAKRLFLQEIGGENIISYISRSSNKYTATNQYDPNADELKVSSEYLEGRGLVCL